jgi:hypothetical protein
MNFLSNPFKRKNTMEHNSERVPAGVMHKNARHALSPVSSLSVQGVGEFASGTRHYQNTFRVAAKHEQLPSGGVRFHVETVPAAEPEHLQKATIDRAEFFARLQKGAASVYSKDRFEREEAPTTIRLEAVAECPTNLVFVGGQGFFAACLSAFAQHLPLALSPDHVWALISFAFAQHVDKHAEELRANFVTHEGKKRLLVSADHMVMSGGGDPDSGSPPDVWERTIFASFSNQIKEHIGEKVHGAVASDFSTTTAVSRAVHETTLMSAMKHYFSYGMGTCCGIPKITLLGSEEDWVSLRARAEALGGLMMPKFSALWMPVLLPVLDEFVASYQGRVNHGFWQSMVKLRHRGGSGACSAVSGWLPILFPYLKSGSLNTNLRPWQEMYFSGPEPNDIPAVLSSAPVDWDYYGTTYDLHFCAGFTGCTQDPSDGTLTPMIGWYVTHDPPSNPQERLVVITAEMESLLKGHAREAKAAVLDTSQPWYVRMSLLFLEQKAIQESFLRKLQKDEERIEQEKTYTWYSESRKQDLEERIQVLEAEKAALEAVPKFASAENMVRTFLA